MKPLPSLDGRISLRPAEAARAIGISTDTLMTWRSLDPPLPIVNIGRCYLVPVRELRDWLSRQLGPCGHEQPQFFPANGHDPAARAAESDAKRAG